jgi:hypothetical protein
MRGLSRHRFWSWVESTTHCFFIRSGLRQRSRAPFKYEGLAAITAWKAQTKKKYHHTVTPLDVAQENDKTVLTATLTGDFPGSPVTVKFAFVLEAGKILSLEIHA